MNKKTITTVIDPNLVIQRERVNRETGEIQPVPAVSQADRLIEMALTTGADAERLDKLLDMKERYDREEARKAFTAALASFKGEDVEIGKDKEVGYTNKDGTFTGYKHASLGNVVSTAVPPMSRHGLSHRWDVKQDNGNITVTCILTHQGGHSEQVTMSAHADDSGKKNPIQQVASTVTYLERYTFLAITGLAVEDQFEDDGKQAAEVVELISEDQVNLLHSMITEGDLDMDIMMSWLARTGAKASTLGEVPVMYFEKVKAGINKAVEKKAAA